MGGGTVVAHPPRLVDSARLLRGMRRAQLGGAAAARRMLHDVGLELGRVAAPRECWLKRHDPWQDIQLLAERRGAGRRHAVPPPKVAAGVADHCSCADAKARARLLDSAAAAPVEAYQHRAVPHVHGAEESFCPPVAAAEAGVAIEIGDERAYPPQPRDVSQATAWIDSVIDHAACQRAAASATRTAATSTGEAVVGYHRLPDALLRGLARPGAAPIMGREYWWGPPYAFSGKAGHGGPGPWKSDATKLPSEGTLPTLHRGTDELVGGSPDFLIALADHPMMPPHKCSATSSRRTWRRSTG